MFCKPVLGVVFVMTNILLFVASRDLCFSFRRFPPTARHALMRASMASGAAKKQKRVRRTEGRTGLMDRARNIAGGDDATFHDPAAHAVRHDLSPFRPSNSRFAASG
jgi:hypothetical protein